MSANLHANWLPSGFRSLDFFIREKVELLKRDLVEHLSTFSPFMWAINRREQVRPVNVWSFLELYCISGSCVDDLFLNISHLPTVCKLDRSRLLEAARKNT